MAVVEQINWTSLQTYGDLLSFTALTVLWITLIVFSIRARKRERRRGRALAGDSAAMPLASDVLQLPPVAPLDDPSPEPLTLHWADDSIVVATTEGLRWQRPKKRDVFIPWHEARLFEVWEGTSMGEDKRHKTWNAEIFEYGYCLYASMRRYIEWTDAPTGSTEGEQLSWEQKTRLQQELQAYITARTHLPLRVARQAQVAPQKISVLSWFLTLSVWLMLAGIPITTAILALTAPLTTTLALNIYVAALCGGVGLTVLFLPLWGLTHPSAPKPPPPSITLPTVPASSDPVTIRLSMSLRDRLVSTLLLIFALVSSGYIIVRSIGDFPDVWVRHTSDYDPHIIASLLFFLCALIGVMFIAFGVFSRAVQIHIDNEGLHWGSKNKRGTIPWVDVAILSADFKKSGKLGSFTIREAPPKSQTVSWSVNARWVQRPMDASSDDAGAQFAAIVAQRSGVQPTTQWE
ncbi:MAG TPA: hypothetical protein VFX24_04985 [Ktedonobacterales bacterium]|nr:hypothetical protein [Ktedonobacterales bacterium]